MYCPWFGVCVAIDSDGFINEKVWFTCVFSLYSYIRNDFFHNFHFNPGAHILEICHLKDNLFQPFCFCIFSTYQILFYCLKVKYYMNKKLIQMGECFKSGMGWNTIIQFSFEKQFNVFSYILYKFEAVF